MISDTVMELDEVTKRKFYELSYIDKYRYLFYMDTDDINIIFKNRKDYNDMLDKLYNLANVWKDGN